MQLLITPLQLGLLLATIFVVLGVGIYAARSVSSAEGYTLGGRSAGTAMLAGSLAGTMVGGGATIGTAQLAASVGLSAWWFTLGSGISFILMGIFYARPLRRTNLETIPQYLSMHYGDTVGKMATIVASLGIFFSTVASILPGMKMISALFGTPVPVSVLLLLLLVFAYIVFGGMKSTGVGGILKMVIIWVTLFLAGASAYMALRADPLLTTALPDFPWYSLLGNGIDTALSNFLSLLVGVLSTQTYIQCLFSAASPKTAMYGSFAGALITIPVGLPCALIGMYMHVARPDVPAMLALPVYLLEHQPAWIGSLALGGIVLSLIGSIGGLSLGISTMLSKDLLGPLRKQQEGPGQLRMTRGLVVVILAIASVFSIAHADSQILFWNFLSMALRGAGVFLPLTLAVFAPRVVNGRWVLLSLLLSTAVAISATLFGTSVKPVFLGVAASAAVLLAGYLFGSRPAPARESEF
ncbi:MAG: Transporter, SSS family [Succiniclasticum sp.]|jgi:solute:Na+ symporter, SSS family